MTYDVYGVGNSLVDIQARVSDEVLAALDFRKGMMTLVDETIQRRVLDPLALRVLEGEFHEGDVIRIDAPRGELEFSKVEQPVPA